MIIMLAEELSRCRVLTDEESRWLEAAIRREDRKNGMKRAFWSKAEDRRLVRLFTRTRDVAMIAAQMNRTENAVWSRIRALRRSGTIKPDEAWEKWQQGDRCFLARRKQCPEQGSTALSTAAG